MPGSSASLRQIELVLELLGPAEGGVGLGEVGARVRHGGAENEPVEVVADVVVVADGRGVTGLGVPAAPEACLLGRRCGTEADRSQSSGGTYEGDPLPQAEAQGYVGVTAADLVAQRQQVEDRPLRLEVAGHVRPRETQLAWVPQQSSQRSWRGDGDADGRSGIAERRTVPAGEPQRRGAPEEGLDDRLDLHGGGALHARLPPALSICQVPTVTR